MEKAVFPWALKWSRELEEAASKEARGIAARRPEMPGTLAERGSGTTVSLLSCWAQSRGV